MAYSIRYNRATNHIEGIPERTTGPATDNANGTGVVAYYAQSACASLTRTGHRMGTLSTHTHLTVALEVARNNASATGRSLCKNCERAALRAIEDAKHATPAAPAEAATPTTYADALAALPAGTDVQISTTSGHTIHGKVAGTGTDGAMVTDDITGNRRQVAYDSVESFEHFDHDGGVWVDPIADRCGERTTVDGIGYPCINRGEHVEHNTALGAAWWTATVHGDSDGTPLPSYDDARRAYMTAADRFEETGEPADRLAADDAWGTFLAAADAAGKCRAFTCYADAEPGETMCVRHSAASAAAAALAAREDADRAAMASAALDAANPNCSCGNGLCEDCAREYRAQLPADRETVTARLDHTEPGKAIALITTGHGREDAPQAWLAHEGGSWLLVDDYDGDTFNVKGPDPERAVHAWAALLGLRIDTLTVDVEYAGGPVSPPVGPAPDERGASLAWTRDREEVNVFHARGRAHDYRLTEHSDGGANLVVSLRGKGGPVEVYRRRYTARAGARRSAQGFEHRYGPVEATAQ